MAAALRVDDYLDRERLDVVSAILNGNKDLVAAYIDGGCDIGRPGEDGLTPLCAAIRNGESGIACLIIPHACIFQKRRASESRSIFSLCRSSLLRNSRLKFLSNRIGNGILNGIWKGFGFAITQFILNSLLSRFDARVMSVFHLKNFWVYSAIRTEIAFGFMSISFRSMVEDRPTWDETIQQQRHRGPNLTHQGYAALDKILEYGGNVGPVMLEMLRAGLNFDDVNDFNGCALRIWEWAASNGHIKVMTALVGMSIDIDIKSGLALRIACYRLHADLCKHLLNLGASVNIKGKGRVERHLRLGYENTPIQHT